MEQALTAIVLGFAILLPIIYQISHRFSFSESYMRIMKALKVENWLDTKVTKGFYMTSFMVQHSHPTYREKIANMKFYLKNSNWGFTIFRKNFSYNSYSVRDHYYDENLVTINGSIDFLIEFFEGNHHHPRHSLNKKSGYEQRLENYILKKFPKINIGSDSCGFGASGEGWEIVFNERVKRLSWRNKWGDSITLIGEIEYSFIVEEFAMEFVDFIHNKTSNRK